MNTKKHFKFPAVKSQFLSLSLQHCYTASCQTSSVQQKTMLVVVIIGGKISDYSGVLSQ